jgi:hypothetical protein
MAVQFKAFVYENKDGNWFIELSDESTQKSEICENLDIFKEKLLDMGAVYGNDIEVKWVKSKTLSPANYQDLENKMAELQKEYADEINELEQNK